MADIFIKIFNLSITASYITLAVILLRLIFKKAPRWITCVLWGLVGIRLIVPFSIESVLSIIPSKEAIPSGITTTPIPKISSGIEPIDRTVNPIIFESFAPTTVGASTNPLHIVAEISAIVWLFGIAAMLIYALISYIRLYLRVRPSILLRDKIYYCDDIDTPFILGIIRPRIYIPSGLDEVAIECVTRHEYAHLRRCDHIIKPLCFLILSVYWFNPLFWVAYILLCRDIEAACDEKVIKEMDNEEKRIYSEALLLCSTHRRMISACPLAFGEVGVKNRIKSVLSYKKPAFWIIILALVASVIVAACFLTDPKTDEPEPTVHVPPIQYINTDYDGVHISLNSQSKLDDGTVTFKVTWRNKTDNDFTFGAQYDIQKQNGDEWVSVDTESERMWQAIAYVLPANGIHETNYSSSGYDISTPGKYRIITSFYADGEIKYTWAEFSVIGGLDENASGEYEGVKIVSGKNETIPLSSMISALSYENGGWLTASGLGSKAFYIGNQPYNPYRKLAVNVPTLRCDGEVELKLADRSYILKELRVYDLENNEIKSCENVTELSEGPLDFLDDLEDGDYYVILKIQHQGEYIEEHARYEETTCEYIFGIIIK